MKLNKKFFPKKDSISFIELRNKKFIRIRRIAKMIRKEITKILQYKDFFLNYSLTSIITISKVEISYDISYAKVFVTFFKENSENEIQNKISILNRYSKFFRKILSKNIRIKSIPEIKFKHDRSFLESIKISNLINKKISNNINVY